MNARRLARSASAALALALIAASCQLRHAPGEIASIVIAGDVCASCSKSVLVGADGRIEDNSAGNETTVRDPGFAERTLGSFPGDAFAGATKTLPPITTPANLAMLIVLYRDGTFERAAVPIGPPYYGDIDALQRWTKNTSLAASERLYADRWKAIDDALARRTMRAVVLQTAATFGRCPGYTAIFRPSNVLTIHEHGAGCPRTTTLRARFARVLEAISDTGASRMHAYYPVLEPHTTAARIAFVTPAATFVFDGPDRTSWGPEFLATETRLDQIVRDLRAASTTPARAARATRTVRRRSSASPRSRGPNARSVRAPRR